MSRIAPLVERHWVETWRIRGDEHTTYTASEAYYALAACCVSRMRHRRGLRSSQSDDKPVIQRAERLLRALDARGVVPGERPEAVVGLIRAPGDRVLVISRSIDGGKFGLPGGKVESGETLLEGLTRELREEIGIEVIYAVELYSAPTRRHQTHVFSIQTYHGIPRSRENQSLDWRHFTELMNSGFCVYAEWYREFFSTMGWL